MTPDGHRLRKHRLRAQHLARFPQLQPVIQRSDLEPAVYEGARGLPRAERTVDPPLQADSSSGSAASTSSIGLQHESLWQGCVCWSWGPSRTSMLARATSHPFSCGHGLPGLWCLTKGASVDFADYVRRRIVHFGVCLIAWPTQNEEVLAALTIPNAQLNAPDALSRCRFIAGDWSLLSVRANARACGVCLCCDMLLRCVALSLPREVLNILARSSSPLVPTI